MASRSRVSATRDIGKYKLPPIAELWLLRLLDDAGDWLGHLSSQKPSHVLAVLLDVPDCDVHTALSPQGLLAKSGLLSVDRERIFNDGDSLFNKKSAAQLRKAWINRMLDDNS